MPLAHRRLIAGNWKMNLIRAEAVALARGVVGALSGGRGLGADVVLCPPFTALAAVGEVLAGTAIALGGQDCHEQEAGPYTGCVSAEMLGDAGCRYVIVGHSERRHGLGETDEMIANKAKAAWRAGLIPILCIGETAEERAGQNTLNVVARQLHQALIEVNGALVIAYEPVWAIGTGQIPTREDIAEVHAHVRRALQALCPPTADSSAIPILYGGSAKADNAEAILGVAEVGGLLAGGASLDAEGFAAMVRAAG